MSEPHKKRGWASICIYAVLVLSASALNRHYNLGEPAASLVIVAAIFIAEGLYQIYRKSRNY